MPCKHSRSPSSTPSRPPPFGAASPPAIASSVIVNYLTLPYESTAFIYDIPTRRIYLCPRKHPLSLSIPQGPLFFGAASHPATVSSALANYLTLSRESTIIIPFIPL